MLNCKKYRHREPNVIHESFDDEVVIINLNSGIYYSLESSGQALWELLGKGATVDEIVEGLKNKYAGETQEIRRAASAFIETLMNEGLITDFMDDKNNNGKKDDPGDTAGTEKAKKSFTAPVLNRYADQKELLLLDPVHEVDDLGWPNKKIEKTD